MTFFKNTTCMIYAVFVCLYCASQNNAPVPLFGSLFRFLLMIFALSSALTAAQFGLFRYRKMVGIVCLWSIGKKLIQLQVFQSVLSILFFCALAAYSACSVYFSTIIGSHVLLFFAKIRLLVSFAHRRRTEHIFSELFRLAKHCKTRAFNKHCLFHPRKVAWIKQQTRTDGKR